MIENSEQIHYSYGSLEATDRGKNGIIELMVLRGCGRIFFLSHKKSARSILPVHISQWFTGIRLWNIYFGFPLILFKIINKNCFIQCIFPL